MHQELLPEPLPAEPLVLVAAWLAEATRQAVQPNPNAMVLATADQHAQPSARVVLCKEIRPQPGYLTFFSNYESRKGIELAANPRAALVMHWDKLRRQVRIEGPVIPTSAAERDNSSDSARIWRTKRNGVAPNDKRTANSVCFAMPRATSRPPTLAIAINNRRDPPNTR